MVLLVGFKRDFFQELPLSLFAKGSIQRVHALEEAEHIISEDLSEIKVVAIDQTLMSDEKVIPTGEFVERIRSIYKGPILIVTDSHNKWRVMKKLGATHWCPQWNTANLITKIIEGKPTEVECST